MPESASWTEQFAGLGRLEPEVRAALERAGRVVRLPKGTRIFGPGQTPQHYVLLIEGDIRVSQTAESGREIVLYRVMPGDSCALTTACLLGEQSYAADAIAETDVVAVLLPRQLFDDLMGRSQAFRHFVLAAFSHRLTDLFKLVDEIAFQRLDVRLAAKLMELAGAADEIEITHQQLASELGTAREVVSRHLHELQRRGWVAAGRGTLRILDRSALRRASGH
jgi:CRP/FNR family transcriptional regulator